MSREDAAAKARRYLGEGRLTVTKVAGDLVRATCRGDGEGYRLGHEMARSWFGDCPVRTRPLRPPGRTQVGHRPEGGRMTLPVPTLCQPQAATCSVDGPGRAAAAPCLAGS